MDYLEKFSALDKECQSNFESSDESAETENDKEYQRIRFDVLALLEEAMIKLSAKDAELFKQTIIEFLCANCGCHLDVEVLDKYTPNVLSPEDRAYINSNSALARWY